MKELVLVGMGGFFGSVLRFLFTTVLKTLFVAPFPVATLFINVTGSFFVGTLLYPLLLRPGSAWFYFLVPGILGGFTTYSAFSGEVFHLFRQQHIWGAVTYIALTLCGGILATGSGYLLSKLILR